MKSTNQNERKSSNLNNCVRVFIIHTVDNSCIAWWWVVTHSYRIQLNIQLYSHQAFGEDDDTTGKFCNAILKPEGKGSMLVMVLLHDASYPTFNLHFLTRLQWCNAMVRMNMRSWKMVHRPEHSRHLIDGQERIWRPGYCAWPGKYSANCSLWWWLSYLIPS